MHTYPFPTVDADLPGLLKRLHEQASTGDSSVEALREQIGPQRIASPAALLGALGIGGVAFAASLVAGSQDEPDLEACTSVVLDVFNQAVESPMNAPHDHEQQVAQWLVDTFALTANPATVLNLIRAEFLIDWGPFSELPEAVGIAMQNTQWALALRGLERLQQSLQDKTPRRTYGLASICLHRLGRYAEAEQWVAQGLGATRERIDIPPLHTEAALLARWGRYDKPVVSIVCTTYNHERYIESAIRGFLSQDCDMPFEILIHDDASTDGTQAVIRRWQQQYPNLIKPLLQTENQYSRGVRPFELLLARAQGEFVATCEGDDFWVSPHKLQRQVSFLQANPRFSSSAHNYYHFVETALTVTPWMGIRPDRVLSGQQLMSLVRLLWLPTLVFRKRFSVMPPERALAPIGDQFLTSYLGTQGPCMYFDSLLGAVRRENEFSSWSPLPGHAKEQIRVKTWAALVRLHERLGNTQTVRDLLAKVAASPLHTETKAALLQAAPTSTTFPPTLAEA